MLDAPLTDFCGWDRLSLTEICDCITLEDGVPVAQSKTAVETAVLLEREYAYVERLAYLKTGCRFNGLCRTWIRPCVGCGCTQDCRCGANYRPIDLGSHVGYQQIVAVTGFRVDGADMDASMLRVDGFSKIARHTPDGDPPMWPVQDYAATIGSPNTWEIEVEYGTAPDAVVLTAVAEMVCERLKAHLNLPCRLPDGVQSITEKVGSGGSRTFTLRPPSDTNSGVPSWDQMCKVYGDADARDERLYVPGGFSTRTIRGTH